MQNLSDLVRAVESLEQTVLQLAQAIEAFEKATHLSQQDELALMAAVAQIYSLAAQATLGVMSEH